MAIIYAVIAKDLDTVLTEYSAASGNFPQITRTILKRIEPNARFSYNYSTDYCFHYNNEDGMTYMCLTDEDFPKRMAFSYLEDIKEKFLDTYGSIVSDAIAFQMNDFNLTLHSRMDYYNTDPRADKITQVRANVDNVKGMMIESVEKILQRGERVELLVKKTDNMNALATGLKKQAVNVRRTMYW
eukprot:CAMPEP_0115010066 /NCGR_PEP_ID=MMETSP0216-20121206/23059_1 /TAXON_ID=223996 /ORGANISM="Protocruzia adherens, Strain Boccale" /LENGTH=184 /DNA_ID=CAMNT_0002378139 /DNA_START=62 /DNA_END=613 /DNA_ORIENTATION=-